MSIKGLEQQLVNVRFTEGLDTRTQPKLVIPSKWNLLNNVSLSKDQTPRRRDGIVSLVAPTGGNGNGLATYNNELLVVNGPGVSSVTTVNSPATAQTMSGVLGNVLVRKKEIRRALGLQDSVDCAYGVGFTCYVWRELSAAGAQSGVNITVVDEGTGTQLLSGLQIHAGATSGPRVVYSGGAFYLFYISGIDLKCRVIATSAPTTVGAAVALISDANLTTRNFDAIDFGRGLGVPSSAMVILRYNGGVDSVQTIQVTRTGTVPAVSAGPTGVFTDAAVPNAGISAVTCVSFSSTVAGVFASSSGTGVTAATIDNTWAVVTAATVIDGFTTNGESHITGVLVGGNVQLFYDNQGAWATTAALTPLRTVTVSSVLAIVLAASTFCNSAVFRVNAAEASGPQGPFIHGKAFTSGTSPFVVFLPVCIMENYQAASLGANTRTNSVQSTFFVYNCSTATIVSKALYGTYGPPAFAGSTPKVATPPATSPLSATQFIVPVYEKTLLSISDGFNISSTGICEVGLTVNTTIAPIRTQLGQATFFSGGDITAYDSAGVTEQGFPLYPEGISAVRAAGGGTITPGTHQILAIYEWVDNAGQRHQSSPCLAVSFVADVAGTDHCTVKVPTLLLSQKTGVTIVLYMTQAEGLTFNRVTPLSSPVANDTTVAFVTITVTSADATIIGNELLYTQPNQPNTTLPNNAPGPNNTLHTHQNRLWFDKADQPGNYGYSQQLVAGTGLQFNETSSGSIDVSGGSLVGFASMDEKLIIFCSRKLYNVTGSGPDSSGANSTFTLPEEIPSDVGCSDARSILQMPLGVMFKSTKGWYLLDRALNVNYIGEGVAAYDANPVSSAVLLEDRQECRFASSAATQLVYSYLGTGQWSTFDVQSHDYLVADAIWWPTTSRYITVSLTDGTNTDTPNLYSDSPGGISARSIVTTMRTSWLHLAQLEGYERIYWLYLTGTTPQTSGTVLDSLKFTVDFDDAYGGVAPGAYNFTLTSIPLTVGMPFDIRSKLRRQKCKSVAFTFTDTPSLSQADGINFQALALLIGQKRGTNKLRAAQTKG